MNVVQSLIDRQLGLCGQFSYDNILRRLVVNGEESFYGLQSSNVVTSFDQDPPIFACRFSEASGYEHILALANEDGRVAIQNTISQEAASTLDGVQCHNNAVFDLAWMPGHKSFVTVSGDHTACLWDVAEASPKRVMVFSNHTRSVKTVAFRPKEPHVFASGARDGHVLVWDTRAAPGASAVLQPCARLAGPHAAARPPRARRRPEPPRAASVTGLVFQDDLTLLSCGECDGNIKVWDLRKNYGAYKREPLPKHSIPYCGGSTRNGYTNLIVDEARVRLYASCMDNVIYCFNISTYNALPERRYVGHENGTFYIKTSLSPDSMYLVSGSSDKNAYIWNVKCSEPVAKLTGHWAEVTCAAWCQRGDPKVVTCSDDARHKLWRLGPEGEVREGGQAGGAGRAEPVPRALAAAPRWGALDKTPSSLKRKTATPSTYSAKRCKPDEPLTERRTKRCLTDSLNASCDPELHAKRPKLDAPTAPEEESSLLPAGVKRHHGETMRTPESSPSKLAREDNIPSGDWSYMPKAGSSFMTPTKNYENKSCKVISPSLKGVEGGPGASAGERPGAYTGEGPGASAVEGPGASAGEGPEDWPDFVRTGEAPHLRLMSPGKKKPDTTNWLTLIVRDRKHKATDVDKHVLAPLSPKENIPPSRRTSVTERTPKSNKKTRTLLKYFSVATK